MYVCCHTELHILTDKASYVCMYVCMYACMHVCMHACMYVCTYACTYVCMHASKQVTTYKAAYASCHTKVDVTLHTYMHTWHTVQGPIRIGQATSFRQPDAPSLPANTRRHPRAPVPNTHVLVSAAAYHLALLPRGPIRSLLLYI